jgi:N-acyl-D-amino-acid deacylase
MRSLSRPEFLRAALPVVLAALVAATATAVGAQPSTPATTTLIRHARVLDGRGTPARIVDVRIGGDRILAVGRLTATARDVIVDATGLTLAPGFIDTHSHHDRRLFDARDALAMVSQGVTTIVAGQDGGGSHLDRLFARLDTQPASVNVASYVGHGAIRREVLGDDFKRVATAAEVARMQARVREEMHHGAIGLSTGLEYDPGIYSAPSEVRALAQAAADSGGRYISHIRSEDRDFWPALNEVIEIGRQARMPVQVSHIKLGMMDLWGQADSVVRVLNRARAAGVNITADIYPYLYWSSNLGVFYPKRNFADSAETAFILTHLTAPDDILFSSVTGHPEYRGKSLAQVATLRGRTPLRTMMDMLAEPDGDDAGVVAKGMSDGDVDALMRWPFANICSDGTSNGLHPRGFGSFAKVLGPYVRDRKVLSLTEAVRKMTSLSANNVGIRERGVIAPGYYADLVLFDAAAVTDHATFETPQALASGVRSTWVNGALVFENGRTTSRYAGRGIRRAAR